LQGGETSCGGKEFDGVLNAGAHGLW
jgi:hypothetical protein